MKRRLNYGITVVVPKNASMEGYRLVKIFKVFLFVFLLHLDTHRAAFGIPIYEGERSAPREDAALAQQDVKRNEGEERYKRNSELAPFNTIKEGRCPYTDDEWKQFRISWNCSSAREGSTYHCTHYNDYEDPREACGIPQFCDKGKGPVIVFPEGHSKVAEIKCDWCPEDYFNPLESIKSDQYSTCPEVRHKCTDRGLVECDIVKGVKWYWTDSKCECDINNNFFPPYKEKNKCSDHSGPCFEDSACEKSPEGFDQIYNFSVSEGKYVCQPGCKEGFEFKTPQSKKCEPVQRNDGNSTTFNNETTIYDSSSFSPTKPESTTTTSFLPTTKTMHDEEGDVDFSMGTIICIVIAAVLGFVLIYVVIGLCNYIYIRRASSNKGNSRSNKQVKFRQGSSSSKLKVQLPQSNGK
ncbi:uncharacterized protein LOC132733548 [Ruditapes philippinarum]|uniref:uncharacterized protein LOC132733548 n=1 Tax=Ruditapes philippinarum TaxID=129788 RepID=UPI00295B4068|nr:uncharacterized protein LOC132733548 [Ruditapes philippinarum]